MSQPTAGAPQSQSQQSDPSQSLQNFAATAEENLVKLATGLAQAGASPQTVSAIHQMADMTREISVALGQQGGAPGSQPGAQPAGQPSPAGGQSSPGGGQPQQQAAGPPTMSSATQHLHEAMQASAQLRQQGGTPQR